MRIFESLRLNTFESALTTFEEFLSDINLFDSVCDTNFGKAAGALDIASRAFAKIDANHDFLISKQELVRYIASGECNGSLNWLLSKFDALERLSFFLGGISRSEIESARDLFHGLNYLKSNFEEFSLPHAADEMGALSRPKVCAYLERRRGRLEIHDERGLNGLIDYIERVNTIIGGK